MNTNIDVREVPTEASIAHSVRQHSRFLKGPIPLHLIGAANRLPGQALCLLLAIRHQADVTRKDWVTLPKHLLSQLGISRDAKARALHQLEDACLIRVVREPGRTTRVRLAEESAAHKAHDSASRMGWQNADWEISAAGLSSRHVLYPIPASQLAEVREASAESRVAKWPVQLAEKSWVNLDTFMEAFEKALQIHKPLGWETLDIALSRQLAQEKMATRIGAVVV